MSNLHGLAEIEKNHHQSKKRRNSKSYLERQKEIAFPYSKKHIPSSSSLPPQPHTSQIPHSSTPLFTPSPPSENDDARTLPSDNHQILQVLLDLGMKQDQLNKSVESMQTQLNVLQSNTEQILAVNQMLPEFQRQLADVKQMQSTLMNEVPTTNLRTLQGLSFVFNSNLQRYQSDMERTNADAMQKYTSETQSMIRESFKPLLTKKDAQAAQGEWAQKYDNQIEELRDEGRSTRMAVTELCLRTENRSDEIVERLDASRAEVASLNADLLQVKQEGCETHNLITSMQEAEPSNKKRKITILEEEY